MKVTQPLKDEHKDLLPKIEVITELAESIYSLQQQVLEERVYQVITFLNEQLIPHAGAEDRVLYPLIDTLSNCKGYTETMRYDHEKIAKLLDKLIGIDNTNKQELQNLLYQLSVIVMLHFKKEEEIYLPFLDAKLPEKDAQELFKRMELAAAEIKLSRN